MIYDKILFIQDSTLQLTVFTSFYIDNTQYSQINYICNSPSHTCQTKARGPKLARNVTMFGPRDHIKCALELAHGLYHIFYF